MLGIVVPLAGLESLATLVAFAAVALSRLVAATAAAARTVRFWLETSQQKLFIGGFAHTNKQGKDQ